MIRLAYIFIATLFWSPTLLGQDTIQMDMNHQLYYFDDSGNENQFNNESGKKALYLTIDEDNFSDGVLEINAPIGTYLFINGSLSTALNEYKTTIAYQKEMASLSLYNKKGLNNVKVALLIAGKNKSDQLEIQSRSSRSFTNFLIIATIILFVFYGYNKSQSEELLVNHFKVLRALTIKTINETLFKIRVLEKSNLMLLIAHSLGIALVLICFFNWGSMDSAVAKRFLFEKTWTALLLWLLLTLLVFTALILKSGLIVSIANIFKIGHYARIHFYTYLRITLLIHAIVFVSILVFSFQFPQVDAFKFTLNLALILMMVRILVTFVKLMNLQSFRKVYLFSYLCATEILPYVFLIKITYL